MCVLIRLFVLILLHNVFSCYYMCPHTGGVGHIMIQVARAFDIQVITPLVPLYIKALLRLYCGAIKAHHAASTAL